MTWNDVAERVDITVRRPTGRSSGSCADPNPEEIHVVTPRTRPRSGRSLKATIESAEAFRRQIEAA
jgi:hypothetical protein